MKERVLMIGLGAMGSVLARLLLENGKTVTVWNRSEEKTLPLRAIGAAYTPNIREAIASNDIILICLQDYPATEQVLQGIPLEGKTIVQLTTGTPHDARVMAASFGDRGAYYLDGAILGYTFANGHTTRLSSFLATKRHGPVRKLYYVSSAAASVIFRLKRPAQPQHGTLPHFPVCSV